MPQDEPISHAEMIAALTEAIVDYADTDSAAPREIARRLRAVLAHLERTQPTDTQADLTERATLFYERQGYDFGLDNLDIIRMLAEFAQSERAEARRAAIEIANAVRCRAAENEGALTGKAFASMSELTRVSGFLAGQRHAATEIESAIRALASPAPQEDMRARLNAKIAAQDAARGRPLTDRERLANLAKALREDEEPPAPQEETR